MKDKLKIAFYGSSLVSAYWNGAATYYRGIIKALSKLGHEVTFYEPDAYERQQHRDLPDPDWAKVIVYKADDEGVYGALLGAAPADVIVKASGVGVFDALLEEEVLKVRQEHQMVIFWDVDAPATLERLEKDPEDPFIRLIPQYDKIFTYGGGQPVIDAYKVYNAQQCVPIYNALDPETHHPVPKQKKFEGELAFLGNRLPDREKRVEDFFFSAADLLTKRKFLIGGSGWGDKSMPDNVEYLGHVYTQDHNAFNCTPKAVLNISRDSMAKMGFSPATRVFEAAGAGACIITDYWVGIETFLEPGKEILIANDGEEVAKILTELTEEKSREVGEAAKARVTKEHTYTHRAKKVEKLLKEHFSTLNNEMV